VRAWAFQEDHLAQVRALLLSLDRYRSKHVARARRDDWMHVVGGWLIWRSATSRADCSSTVVGWLAVVQGRIPHRLSRTEFAELIRGVATMRLLRPVGRLRGVANESAKVRRAAYEAARPTSSSPLAVRTWMVTTLMYKTAALRLADAVRVAAGEASVEEVSETEWLVFPHQEKTDMTGAKEVEPVLLRIPTTETRLMRRWCRLKADASSMIVLEGAMKVLCRRAGIADVRALRRDAGEAMPSRAEAGILLRHQPGSSSTPRYATTKDRVVTLRQMMAAAANS
jgi:hypothetical protein